MPHDPPIGPPGTKEREAVAREERIQRNARRSAQEYAFNAIRREWRLPPDALLTVVRDVAGGRYSQYHLSPSAVPAAQELLEIWSQP